MKSLLRTTPATVLLVVGALVVGSQLPAAAHEIAHKISGTTIKAHTITGNRLKNNTVTGTQIKESTLGTVPTAKTATTATTASKLPALKWHTLTLINGWHAGGVETPGFAIDAQGLVHLRGQLSNATAGDNNDAFTVPTSIAPLSKPVYMAVAEGENGAGELRIEGGDGYFFPNDDSAVVASSGAALDGVTYSVP
jgi:hypothetical protein